MTSYQRGSEWRRWDLHIHSPESAREVSFPDWPEYVELLEGAPRELVAIGITDYWSIEGYKKLLNERSKGRLKDIHLVLPNIEMRLTENGRNSNINIHFICSNLDEDHVSNIESALSRLKFPHHGQDYSCTSSDMIRLGRAFGGKTLDDHAAYKIGNNQFKVSIHALQDWLGRESWLRANSLVAVSNNDGDGVSGLKIDGGNASLRQNIYRTANIIFSPKPSCRRYFSGKGADSIERLIETIGGPKPCLHGSDAHGPGRLFQDENKRYCWIKADPTFDGLRQVIFEPEERVHIAEKPPQQINNSQIISSISLTNSGSWFDDSQVVLNGGLTAIIGQKGSGKSALAELLAYGAGVQINEDEKGFLRRAGKHLNGLSITMTWADGYERQIIFSMDECRAGERPLRYLSQQSVERLCSGDHTGYELVKEIEKVLFDSLDPSETLNSSAFTELRNRKTRRFTDSRLQLSERAQRLIAEYQTLDANRRSLVLKKQRVLDIIKERGTFLKQMPDAQSEEEQEIREQLFSVISQHQNVTAEIANKRRICQTLEDSISAVDGFERNLRSFYYEIKDRLVDSGISDGELTLFEPRFIGDPRSIIRRYIQIHKEGVEELEGTETSPAPNTRYYLLNQIENLRQRHASDEAQRERINAIQKRIDELNVEERRIAEEVSRIEGPEQERRSKILEEISQLYTDIVKTYYFEMEVLKSLYQPLEAFLAEGSTYEQSLGFSVEWHIDKDSWIEGGVGLLDKRYRNQGKEIDEICQKHLNILEEAIDSLSIDQVKQKLTSMLQYILEEKDSVHRLLKPTTNLASFLSWIIDTKHLSLTYGLTYNGTEVKNLSPGDKGIVLLIIYLGIDRSDNLPLIIDQPEENLDNISIHQMLATYFRIRKRKRQIIIITHNPNLVVGTDAEQIIIAEASREKGGFPRFSYKSGGLENQSRIDDAPGIREEVCRILEGGKEAFLERERRYGIL
jgi:predicted ATPase